MTAGHVAVDIAGIPSIPSASVRLAARCGETPSVWQCPVSCGLNITTGTMMMSLLIGRRWSRKRRIK